MLQQQKDPHESLMEFWECFPLLSFQAPKSQMKFQYLMDRYEYVYQITMSKNEEKSQPHSAYFGDGVAQSQADTVTVTSEYLPSPHQTAPPP